jgi:hypothetical protein
MCEKANTPQSARGRERALKPGGVAKGIQRRERDEGLASGSGQQQRQEPLRAKSSQRRQVNLTAALRLMATSVREFASKVQPGFAMMGDKQM